MYKPLGMAPIHSNQCFQLCTTMCSIVSYICNVYMDELFSMIHKQEIGRYTGTIF